VARGLIDARAPQAAIDYLTRARLIRLMNDAQRYAEAGKPVSLAPLQVLLAEASERVGEIDDARRAYRVAAEKLPAGDPLHADILVGRGRIALGVDDDPEAALELFQRVEREFPATPLFVDALVGAAEAQSRLGQLDLASRNLGRAVSEVAFRPAQDRRWRRQHRLVEAAIVSQFDHLFGMGKYDDALSFIQLLGPLYQRIGAPSDYALQLAAVHEKLGESLHEHADQAATGPAGGANPVDASTGRRLMAQQAAVHFEKAGDFYRQHADQVDRALDDTAHGESLWRSAHCYDRAQSWAKAIEAYSEFVATRLKDARLLRAAHQLGLALLADGQHQAAVDRFEPLVRTHPRSPEAFDSFVPLARAYVALERTADAVRLLRGVVDDHPVITPQSSHYRDALVERGRLRHRLGDYPTAIRRLAQAGQLYGDGELAPTIHFLLGDSYRQSIDVIAQRLDDVLTAADRMELQAERAERLEQAQSHFSAVVAAYRARPIGELSELERLRFRNASFYAADAAYDLGRYEQAIRLYDEAAKRWDQHPASLVALVQIVNAYCEMGAIDEARVANQRARWQLEQIPDEAFDDPTLPMSRQHWQDWLRWSSELDLFGPEDGRVSTEASADGESGP